MNDIRADLEPGMPEDVIRLAERLQADCPLPDAAFRGGLRRHLEARSRRLRTPERVRTLITGYATAGSLLLTVGGLSAGGVGPLG